MAASWEITPEKVNQAKESVRIRRALKGIDMAMDILVVPEDKLEELSATPGLIYREALNKGKVKRTPGGPLKSSD